MASGGRRQPSQEGWREQGSVCGAVDLERVLAGRCTVASGGSRTYFTGFATSDRLRHTNMSIDLMVSPASLQRRPSGSGSHGVPTWPVETSLFIGQREDRAADVFGHEIPALLGQCRCGPLSHHGDGCGADFTGIHPPL